MTSCDVLVVGGGPAGAVAACVLARAGASAIVVDKGRREAGRVGESLVPAARRILRELELLGVVDDEPHLACPGNVAAWGSDELHATDFVRGLDGPGWQLDRARFDEALRDAARAAGAAIRDATRMRAITRTDRGWRVTLNAAGGGVARVETRWLVDASGRSAAVARRAGAVRIKDDEGVAFVATCAASSHDRDARTLVEATPHGWWYTALAPGARRVVGFVTHAALATRELNTLAGFEAALARTRHVRGLTGASPPLAGPDAADASSARLDRVAGERWIAVGDAAIAFDPLSSRGLFDALYSGMVGARAIIAAEGGDATAIEAYQARIDEIYAAYRAQRRAILAEERRWPDAPFWRRAR